MRLPLGRPAVATLAALPVAVALAAVERAPSAGPAVAAGLALAACLLLALLAAPLRGRSDAGGLLVGLGGAALLAAGLLAAPAPLAGLAGWDAVELRQPAGAAVVGLLGASGLVAAAFVVGGWTTRAHRRARSAPAPDGTSPANAEDPRRR